MDHKFVVERVSDLSRMQLSRVVISMFTFAGSHYTRRRDIQPNELLVLLDVESNLARDDFGFYYPESDDRHLEVSSPTKQRPTLVVFTILLLIINLLIAIPLIVTALCLGGLLLYLRSTHRRRERQAALFKAQMQKAVDRFYENERKTRR